MLNINGQTYFNDDLLEEEVDFMCGMCTPVSFSCLHQQRCLCLHNNLDDGNVEIASWWPRPYTWATSGLNIGFWSGWCEAWF
ncbi:hypothetical protein BDR04DRAFT_1039094 [Suillus decipiens]|nr:hypothetical protein BDR04DRAFT_1039094 [Suillus decipiens]